MKMWLIECWSWRKPGSVSSRVTTPPPNHALRSSTTTLRPATARYAAATRPLWPDPTATTSACCIFKTPRVDVADPFDPDDTREAVLGSIAHGRHLRTVCDPLCAPGAHGAAQFHRRRPA